MAVLAECPGCRRKQSLRNKTCAKCGTDLDKAKRSQRVRYWIHFRLFGGKQRKEYVGTSVEDARTADGKRRTQKKEGRIFDMVPGADETFDHLAEWYLGLATVKSLRSYRRVTSTMAAFLEHFGPVKVNSIKPEHLGNTRASAMGSESLRRPSTWSCPLPRRW